MTVAIIVNPAAGAARAAPARLELARRTLADLGASAEVFAAERPGHARELAADLARRGRDLVVAWGGDGTVNEVGSGLAFTATALGIVPAGSGNGLARELGIDRRPAEALRAALAGRARMIDAGELGGRLFFNIAGVGFDAEVALRFNARPHGRRGRWPYVWLIFRELARYQPDRYAITLDELTYEREAFALILANSCQYGNGLRVAPGARPDDGFLDALVVDHRSVVGHLWRARHLFWGTPDRAEGIIRRRVTRGAISGARALTCHVDGESFTIEGHAEFRVHPRAVTLRM